MRFPLRPAFRSAVFAVAFGCLFASAAFASTITGFEFDEKGNAFAADQVLITFRAGTSALTARSIVARNGGDPDSFHWFSAARTIAAKFRRTSATMTAITDELARTALVTVYPDQVDALGFCTRVSSDINVVSATPNYIKEGCANPDDALYRLQWGVRPNQKAPTNSIPFGVIGNFPNAWDVSTGRGVIIAILDSGADLSHEDLKPNLLVTPDLVFRAPNLPDGPDNPPNTFDTSKPWDDLGHGTLVAGIAAARWRNKVGVVGAAPEATILPIKMLDNTPPGGVGTIADEADAIHTAVNNSARVINISMAGTGTSTVERDAILFAQMNGAVVVAAMGNNGAQVLNFPAAYPGVVAVGSHMIGAVGAGTALSQRLRSTFSTTGPWITLAAPGGTGPAPYNDDLSDIFSTFPTYFVADMDPAAQVYAATNVTSKYAFFAGTSVAAAHVSGAAALFLSKNPSFSPPQTWARFARFADRTAVPVTTNNVVAGKIGGSASLTLNAPFDNFIGYGILDPYRLLAGIEAPGVSANGQIIKGIPQGYVRLFAWSPRNQIVGAAGLNGLQNVSTDRVINNIVNSFRVIAVDDKAKLLSSAKVTARFFGGDPTTPIATTQLFDDGAHNDLLANDGVFGALVPVPSNDFNSILTVQYIASAKSVTTASNLFIRFRVQ